MQCFLPSLCTSSFDRSAVCSLQAAVFVSMKFSVLVRSIKDLNLNMIKITACVVGSRTQLTFLPLAASQQSSDHSDKISRFKANLKVATQKTTAI